MNNTAEAIGPLSGTGGSSVTLGSGALIVNSTSNSTFSGAISGTGELYKTGSAQLLLNGASTYSGGTTVADGASLMFWASSAMTVENDITLGGMGPGPGRPALNQDGGAGLVTVNGDVTLAATSDVGVGGSSWNDMRINGTISGPGGLVVKEENVNASQERTLFLSSANSYQGGTTVAGGSERNRPATESSAIRHRLGRLPWQTALRAPGPPLRSL